MAFVAGLPFIVALLIIVCFPLLWLLTLIAALVRKTEDSVEKLTWVLVIILLPVIGAIIYWILKGGAIVRVIFLTLLLSMILWGAFFLLYLL